MNLKFVLYIISSMCSKYPQIKQVDCIQFMHTCTFNENMIGTYDTKKNLTRTLESMLEDCRESWYEQDK